MRTRPEARAEGKPESGRPCTAARCTCCAAGGGRGQGGGGVGPREGPGARPGRAAARGGEGAPGGEAAPKSRALGASARERRVLGHSPTLSARAAAAGALLSRGAPSLGSRLCSGLAAAATAADNC